jgi:hypothetical protein
VLPPCADKGCALGFEVGSYLSHAGRLAVLLTFSNGSVQVNFLLARIGVAVLNLSL